MGDEDLRKKHALFGSGGMAAAGMIPTAKKKPVVEEPVEEEVISSEDSEEVDSPKVETPEPEPEPEIIEYSGHKAVVMGHSGAGNFGHNLDMLFHRLDGVRLDAIANGDSGAVEESRTKTGAKNAYADYREMLDSEQADIVAIAPRWTDQRYDMIKAALEKNAHVICERPIARTLKEADELLELAKSNDLKIAILHQMRCDPHLSRFYEEREELIGDLLQMNVFGMMDERAGGEDLLVLGTHLFDIVRWFGGDVSYCTAQVTKNEMPALAEDSHESEKEDLGRVLGDSIHAEFVMDSGVHVTYVSDQRFHDACGPWGIEFVGSKGRARLFAGMPPTMSLLVESDPASPTNWEKWVQWPDVPDEYHAQVDHTEGLDAANRLVVNDWLEAIKEDRDPKASGESAMKSLEMIHGIWQAAVTMKRAYFPLVNRLHPLAQDDE